MKVILFFVCMILIESGCNCQQPIIDPVQQIVYDVKLNSNLLTIKELEESGNCLVDLKIIKGNLEEFRIKRLRMKNLKNNKQLDCIDKSCLDYEGYKTIENELVNFFQKNLIILKLTDSDITENKNVLIKIN